MSETTQPAREIPEGGPGPSELEQSFQAEGDGPLLTIKQFSERYGLSQPQASGVFALLTKAGVVKDTGNKTTGAGMKGARIFQFPAKLQIDFS